MNDLIEQVLKSGHLLKAVFSRSQEEDTPSKIIVRPIQVKSRIFYQCTTYDKNKAFHKNLDVDQAFDALKKWLEQFLEVHFFTPENDYHCIKKKKGEWKILKKRTSTPLSLTLHNRKKNYLLTADEHITFWQSLGVIGKSGQILTHKYAKYKQVNRFLEIVSTILPYLPQKKPLEVIDFGCGKAYLTFALSHYLEHVVKIPFKILGIDLKEDVVAHLEKIRKDLNIDQLRFVQGDIKEATLPEKVDLVISLHACDTATDALLKRAVKANATVILSVPCCHHAYFKPIKNPILDPILKHSILKERFSAIALDAARISYLETQSYKTDIMEFIDTEHTPKNLMIRAIKVRKDPIHVERSKTMLNHFLEFLHLPDPSIFG